MARKKKNKQTKPPRGLPELDGYKLEDFIYCYRYPDKSIARGYITGLFSTSTGKFIEFVDQISGQFRVSLLEDIIANLTVKHINSANSKLARNNKSAERIAEKKKLKKKR